MDLAFGVCSLLSAGLLWSIRVNIDTYQYTHLESGYQVGDSMAAQMLLLVFWVYA